MCWRARAGVCCSIFSFLFVGLDFGIVLGLLFGQSSSLLSREHAERGHSGVYWHPRRLYGLATVASTGSIILVSLDSRRKCPARRRWEGDGSRGTPLLGRSRHPMGVETQSRDGRPITTRRFPSAGCQPQVSPHPGWGPWRCRDPGRSTRQPSGTLAAGEARSGSRCDIGQFCTVAEHSLARSLFILLAH